MSKWERVNLKTLRSCCISVIHAHAGYSADGDTLACPACGLLIVFRAGIWTRG